MPSARDWETIFWGHVREDDSGCWLWQGSRFANGYGQFGSRSKGCRKGRTTLAHRIAWEIVVGLVPAGLTLDHLCRNRLCVNPAHLEPVTIGENVRRGRRATATHCDRGHPLSGPNLYVAPNGRRNCKECRRAAMRAFHKRNPGYGAAKMRQYREEGRSYA